MTRDYYLTLICIFCFWNASFAQTDQKTNDVYAEQKQISSDLDAKSTLIPFSLPDPKSMVTLNESGHGVISLPFVTVKGRKLTLPITLSYTTDGIKVDQNSSDVGLGWNINIGSITRDFGAFEPDYTFTGSELAMPDVTGYTYGNKKLKSVDVETGTTSASYIAPIGQNKIIDYNYATGTAPDNYVVNVPGLSSNDFWNKNAAADATSPTPVFVFSEKESWQIGYQKQTFTVAQEISRINEYCYSSFLPDAVDLDNHYNMASAIGLFPYVPNGQSSTCVFSPGQPGIPGIGALPPVPTTTVMFGFTTGPEPFAPSTTSSGQTVLNPNATVQYEDYSQFMITTDDGTKYLFARPLRGQKYLFTEEPFWSTSVNAPWASGVPMGGYGWSFGEFWKTDFIAEWLLTEIHSNDYYDANSDGIADDGDDGDWIRINYGTAYQCENNTQLPYGYLVPAHREFLNFVETDRPSAIWKERAYVSTITTPVEVINFATENRFDVNHDYFRKPFNRYNGEYVYEDVPFNNSAFGPASCSPIPWSFSTGDNLYPNPALPDCHTIVNYPAELMRYDNAITNENISGTNAVVQCVTLNYAPVGSSRQLAVSNHLIIDNDGTFKDYDPSTCGFIPTSAGQIGLDPSYFPHTTGRGKTTLIGIDYRGTSSSSTNKISYTFGYGNNPAYDNIHMQQIWSLASAGVRESRSSVMKRWTGIRTIQDPSHPGTSYNLPNSMLPWKSLMIDHTATNETASGASGIRFTSTTNWGNPVYEDELGYYYDGSTPNQGRDAWCLSQITLPYGGNVNIKYALDQSDINNDRLNWNIPDYCLPEIGYYNNVAINTSILQQLDNEWESPLPSLYTSGSSFNPPFGNNFPQLNNEYYYYMNENTGGLRISEIDYNDNFGAPTVTKTYNYGTGHYTAPPADYWQNYITGFEQFMYNDYIKHGNLNADGYDEVDDVTPQVPDFSAFYAQLMRLNMSLKIDPSYRKNAKHYYEYIEEVNSDGGKTRWYYGALIPNTSLSNPRLVYAPMKYGLIKFGNYDRQNNVDMLSTDLNQNLELGKYKTEYYNNLGQLLKQESADFTYTIFNSNSIPFSGAGVSMAYGDYFPYVPAWQHFMTTLCPTDQGLFSSSPDCSSITAGCVCCNGGLGLQPVSALPSFDLPFGLTYHENQLYNNIPSWLLTSSGEYADSDPLIPREGDPTIPRQSDHPFPR